MYRSNLQAIRLRKGKRPRIAICMAALALVLALVTAAFASVQETYFGPAGMDAYGGWARSVYLLPRDYNRVYHPAPYTVGLKYSNLSWVYGTSNPYVDARGGSGGASVYAFCTNGSIVYQNPVTCQTTAPA